MATEIEREVTKFDLDSSGFLKGAQEVLKAIDKLETAMGFKGIEKKTSGAVSALAGIGDAASKASAKASEALVSAGDAASKMSSAIDLASANSAEALVAVADAMDQVSTDMSAHADEFASAFSSATDETKQSIEELSEALSKIGSSVKEMSASVRGEFDSSANNFTDISTAVSAMQSEISDNMDHIVYAVNSVADNVEAMSKASIESFTNMSDASVKAADTIADAFGKPIDASTGVESTSKETSKKVKDDAEDAAEGVNSSFKKIGLYAGFAATLVGSAAVMAWKKWGDEFPEKMKGLAEKFATYLEPVKEKTNEVISSVISKSDLIKGAIKGVEEALKLAFPNTMEVIGVQVHDILDGIINDYKNMKAVITGTAKEENEATKEAVDGAKKTADATKEVAVEAEKAGKAVKEVATGEKEAAANAEGAKNEGTGFYDALKKTGEAAKGLAKDTVGVADAVKGVSSIVTKLAIGDIPGAIKAATTLGKSMGDALKADNIEGAAKSVNILGNAFKTLFGDSEQATQTLSGTRSIITALGKDFKNLPDSIEAVGGKSKLVGKVLEETMKVGTNGVKDLGKAMLGLPGATPALSLAFYKVRKEIKETLFGAKEDSSLAEKAVQTVGNAAELVGHKFSALGAIGFSALQRITNKAMDAGEKLIKSLSVDQISAGWNEYGLKINSTQTIMASTGESLSTVNGYLEELNKYADKTIYSFSDMTTNIGKFTNAGVDLKTAVKAIQGISNEAALSGANAQEASRAMYNFAQAISSGSVKLIDWKSIENANMATKGFKEQLIETAVELKKVKKVGDQYVSLTKDANGHTSDAFTATKNFNNSLSAQWMTTEVLTKTLSKYSDETTDFGKKAFAAAQDIKTGKQLLDTMQEAVGSGWSKTFELIIGDFEEAKKLWTGINNLVGPILDGISNARNGLLGGWRALGGRETLIEALKNSFTNLVDILKAAKEGFETFMPPLTATRLKELTDKFASFIGKLKLSDEQLSKVKGIFQKVGEGAKFVKDSIGQIVESIKQYVGKSSVLAKFKDTISNLFGGKDIFSKNGALDAILSIVKSFNGIKTSALNSVVNAFSELVKSSGSHSFGKLSGLGGLVANVVSTLGGLAGHLGEIAKGVKEVVDPIAKLLVSHLPDIFGVVSSALDLARGAIDVIASLVKKYLNDWKTIFPPLVDIALKALKLVLDIISKLVSAFGDFLSKHADAVAGFIKALIAIKGIVSVVVPIVKVVFAIKRLIDMIKLAKGAFTTLQTVMTSLGIADAAADISKAIGKNLVKSLLGTIGPALAVAAAIAAVTAAIGVAIYVSKKHQKQLEAEAEALYGLSDSQKDLIAKVRDTREEYDQSESARRASVESIDKETNANEVLVGKLRDVVDENGKVKDGKEELAWHIINQLNEALGLEIELVDGQITDYKTLNEQLEDTIKKKRILALLETGYDDYKTAKYNYASDQAEYSRLKRDLEAAETKLQIANIQYEALNTEWWNALKETPDNADVINKQYMDLLTKKETEIKALEAALNGDGTDNNPGLRSATEKARQNVVSDQTIISNYEGTEKAYYDPDVSLEETQEKAAKLAYNVQEASANNTSEALRKQVNDFKESYTGIMDSVAEGILDANSSTVTDITSAYTAAQNELAKQIKLETSGDNYSRTGGDVVDEKILARQKETSARRLEILKQEYEDARKAYDHYWSNVGYDTETEKLKTAAKEAQNAYETELKNQSKNSTAGEELPKAVASSAEENSDVTAEAGEKNTKSFFDRICDLLGPLGETLRGIMDGVGRDATQGLITGMEALETKVAKTAMRIAGLIPSTMTNRLEVASPSKVAIWITENYGEGLVIGMANMERAVKKESQTLSEVLINGAGSPLSSISDILSGDFTDSFTITPVLDLSNIQNGGSMIGDILSSQHGIGLGRYDVSGLFPKPEATSKTGDPMTDEIRGLREDMAKFNERLSRLQVRMDKGALVGELIDPIDYELGQRASVGQRG